MVKAKNEEKLAEQAKVIEVAERLEHMTVDAASTDVPWLERAAKLLRRWAIDL